MVGHCCESGDLLTCKSGSASEIEPRPLEKAEIGEAAPLPFDQLVTFEEVYLAVALQQRVFPGGILRFNVNHTILKYVKDYFI